MVYLFLLHFPSTMTAKHCPVAARSLGEIVNGLAWDINVSRILFYDFNTEIIIHNSSSSFPEINK